MRVVLAPDSLKGTVDAPAAAAALAAGWARVRPGDTVVRLPLADGGEGTLDALGAGLDAGARRPRRVRGPGGRAVDAAWLQRPDGTAVVELARAAGLHLLDPPDPLGAGTAGVGELLDAAAGSARRVLLTLGGSATTDGGAGALTALGARLLDAAGDDLPPGGAALARLHRVDLRRLRPPPPDGLECLVDVTNPLLGRRGAAAVFGPQKGASPADVAVLDAALARLADVLADAAPHPVDPALPGAGAAGGTAFGLLSCWPGEMVSGAAAVADAVGLPAALSRADLVVTGEGRYDAQSADGKVVGHLLGLAAAAGVGVVVVAGQVDPAVAAGAGAAGGPVRTLALDALAGSTAAALAHPRHWLEEAAARVAADPPAGPEGREPTAGSVSSGP